MRQSCRPLNHARPQGRIIRMLLGRQSAHHWLVCGLLGGSLALSACAGSTFGTTFGKSSARRVSQESGADPLVVSEVTISGQSFEHPAEPPRELMEQLLGELSPEWQQRAAELTDAMTRLSPTTALGLTRSTDQSAPPRFIVYIQGGQLSLLRLGDDLRSDRVVAALPMPGAAPAKTKPKINPKTSPAAAPSNDRAQTSQAKSSEPAPTPKPATTADQSQTTETTEPPTETPNQGPNQSGNDPTASPGPLLQPTRTGKPKT